MTVLAPIVLFTYKRLDVLIQCLDSLKKCPDAVFSDLIVVSDYQATAADQDKVEAVRHFLPSITGFKSIEIIERVFFGLDNNIIEGIRMMAAGFLQFIVLEDEGSDLVLNCITS